MVIMPIKTVNEVNSHEHWRARQKRAKWQRSTVACSVRVRCEDWMRTAPVTVTLTRIAPSAGTADIHAP